MFLPPEKPGPLQFPLSLSEMAAATGSFGKKTRLAPMVTNKEAETNVEYDMNFELVQVEPW